MYFEQLLNLLVFESYWNRFNANLYMKIFFELNSGFCHGILSFYQINLILNFLFYGL